MTLALGLVGAALCLAADGFIGHLEIETRPSRNSPGTAKNSTVVYSTMGDNMMVHHRRHRRPPASPAHNEWMGKFRRQRLPGHRRFHFRCAGRQENR